ncbi:MAG: respiratory nitrate reductase subunit gamma [Deltaproteobacteria bacterium RIFCSPLOWO2_12_FULL_40_28]|nr:MAG: respiratory nitrate reductase subunit gamma [Deltaproteobacteria bacterium RIFCSPHIGHO2_02_FULL_40_28]OGQ19429.1 MAG: respiratory nitrate reductase subunit gamma [Deltaproteobacteria bacterium RIFCSPHIGHO2_12_FULL_40_32]OGQ39873.1 MAG: respiratory nitrate reductase subunit gamma [Deltaproteobacteria bacterium RIFCSPLOWO2_02_FULL_40_36]OGQ53867.1 MAG: respiratory nitrate reductase subunit gamma [Deltaproteobacteria bacterium RIFCSPLOWO2_12_FULL_40_28]
MTFNNFLFVALPYIAIITFVIGSIQRYRATGFKVSSLSSQFLEGRKLYFGSMAFHWGILAVFMGHLITFLFPTATLAWNSNPVRLIVLEVMAFTFGLSILIGLTGLFLRRLSTPRIKMVTNRMDLIIELLLLSQVVLGCWIALGYRWGASWFASDLSPYLWSIVKLNPQIEAVSAMPPVIRTHIVGAFVIIGMIPFTRLMHFLVAPFHYIFRPLQLVMWTWDRRRVRDPKTVWTVHRPKNN